MGPHMNLIKLLLLFNNPYRVDASNSIKYKFRVSRSVEIFTKILIISAQHVLTHKAQEEDYSLLTNLHPELDK